MLTAGSLILVFLFLPAALISSYKAEGNSQNKLLYIVTYLTCFVVFIAMLFKIMHWPYAGLGLVIALPFPYVVFLPVFLVVTSKNKNFNIYNTVFVLLLLAINSVFSALLALNVSMGTIVDSYNLSRDYCHVEAAMADLKVPVLQPAVAVKMDEVVKIVNNYQDKILKYEGFTREQWKENPGNIKDAESVNIPMAIMASEGESYPGDRLIQAQKDLVSVMEQSKGYEMTAKSMPLILGLADENGKAPDWTVTVVTGANLSWVLIYLDGLEANLKMVRASIPLGM
jgi:hypothetical protein